MVTAGGKVRVFFSYSHKDEELRDQLETHLAILKRLEVIETWHDRKITPGHEWEQAIWEEFDSADLILLLISADFLDSDFCFSEEMHRAMERQATGTAQVLPIVIRACVWQGALFGRLGGLPKDMRPVTSWSNRDEAWTNVAEGIGAAVSRVELRKLTPATIPASMSLRLSEARIVDAMRTFQLEICADAIPGDGYVGWQTLLYHDSLLYTPVDFDDEWVWQRPLAMALRSVNVGAQNTVLHGEITGLLPPLPRRHYTGPFIRLALQCPGPKVTDEHSHEVLLLSHTGANTNGSCYLNEEGPYPAEPIAQVDVPGLGTTDVAARIELICKPPAD